MPPLSAKQVEEKSFSPRVQSLLGDIRIWIVSIIVSVDDFALSIKHGRSGIESGTTCAYPGYYNQCDRSNTNKVGEY